MNEQNLQLGLFAASEIAIPLAAQNHAVNPQPNFLVITAIFDTIEFPFPDATGNFVPTKCLGHEMKLVYREVLPEENGQPAEISEIIFRELRRIGIPFSLAYLFESHQTMIDNEKTINQFLPFLNFRGCLAGFKVKFDAKASKKYLKDIEAVKKAKELAEQKRYEVMNPPAPVVEALPNIPTEE